MSDNIDRKSKRSILAEIKKEVEEFHPLLDKLLPKLPRISNVEYTHGPNEKGADFVISRLDDTIGDIDYIGVIAKTGPINNALTNIFDQIDDCSSSRIILKGSKEIYLTEIWIINNETISSRAQEKIHDRYHGKKIKFIERDTIANWIDKNLPTFWSKIPIAIAQYLQDIHIKIAELDSAFSLFPATIKPFFVETQIRKINHDYKSSIRNKDKHEDIEKVIARNKITLIESGPGSGKSQLLRNTVKKLTSPDSYIASKSIPFLLTYSDFTDIYNYDLGKIQEHIIKEIGDSNISSSTNFIIFIDGFDEKIEENRDIPSEIQRISIEIDRYTNIKVVITTRPLSIIDYRKYLPNNSPGYTIVPFGTEKILRLIDKICQQANISSRLFEDIKNNGLFKQLPKNPISAILLANLINENSKELPANLSDIYRKYCELMLGRWDIEKGLQSDKEYETAKEILTYIAKFFIENGLTQISKDEAIGHFKCYLSERNLDIDPVELYKKVSSRSGILQENSNNKTVYFKHRSFAEYFYAMYKTRHADDHFFDTRAFDPMWRNIYFFYVGLLKDCEEVIEKILTTKPVTDADRFFKVINMADFFLAAYTTPYKIIEDNLPILINEYRDFYLDVIANKVETPLSELPEIAVLEFFQAIINSSYSYQFFIKALNHAIIEIGSDDSSTDVEKAYSLFFISVIYRALDQPNPFDGLIDQLKGKIPLPLQFGLFYESRQDNKPSKLLKRVERNLKTQLKKQKDIHLTAKKLHDKPLKLIKS